MTLYGVRVATISAARSKSAGSIRTDDTTVIHTINSGPTDAASQPTEAGRDSFADYS